MIRPLYSLVLLGAQPLLRRKLRRRGQAEPGYLEHVDERFGRYHSDWDSDYRNFDRYTGSSVDRWHDPFDRGNN